MKIISGKYKGRVLEGFELMASDKEKTKEDIKKIRKAWRLFEYHFHDLWN